MFRSKIEQIVLKISRYSDNHPVIFPIALLLFALTTYGVLIATLGFYWDDWPPVLLSHLSDKSLVWQYFAYDRPFQSWTYYVLFPLCRDSAFLWQLSAIIARWTAALSLFYTFLNVFPRLKNLLQWAAVLFVVFPGFADHSASVSFGSHFMVYTIFGISMLFMVTALQNPKKFWLFYPLSLVFTAFHLFSMEYFVGLELLRPILIYWMLIDGGLKKRKGLQKTLFYWLPFLAVLIFYIYWRMVVYPNQVIGPSGSNYPYLIINFIKAPLDTLVLFIQTIYSDLRFLLLDIWTSRIIPIMVEIKSATLWLSLIIGLGAAYILHFMFREEKGSPPIVLKNTEVVRNIVLSLAIIFFGLFPVWSTLRQITRGKWSDRFDIPVIFGVTILVVTLIYLVFKTSKIRNFFLIVIVGLSIGYQVRTSNDYRKDFNRQKAFYSQLAWRIPSLESGTTIYSPGIPSEKEADYSISMGVNLLFNSGELSPSLDYWFTGPRYYSPTDLASDPNILIKDGLRVFNFNGISSKVVSIFMPDDGCLWVIDPYYALSPEKIGLLGDYGKLSNQELIGATGNQTNHLSKIIDTSPQVSWCYYFEKGDLAQSKGKYVEAVAYYEEAVANQLAPFKGIELLPFVKAYAQLGSIDEAVELSEMAFKMSEDAKPSICQVWHDVLTQNSAILLSSVETVYNSQNCSILDP